MNINWKVRVSNKLFWFAFIPAAIVLIQSILSCFGVEFDFSFVEQKLINIIEAIFTFLAVIGVVIDPTTKGVSDSNQAMTYKNPKE